MYVHSCEVSAACHHRVGKLRFCGAISRVGGVFGGLFCICTMPLNRTLKDAIDVTTLVLSAFPPCHRTLCGNEWSCSHPLDGAMLITVDFLSSV